MEPSVSEKSLEGWVPEIGAGLTIEQVIDYAFDYRGNTTLVLAGGEERVAYVSNRDASAPQPFIQIFDEQGEGPITIPYTDIRTIKFTGKDTAAGKSWEAWVKRKAAEKLAAQQEGC